MHDRSESRALRLLGHLPVAHAPELFVRDALNQIGHCSQPEVTTSAKHSRENGADLFAIPFALLRRQKMVSGPYIVGRPRLALGLAHFLDTVVVIVDGLTKNVAAAMTAHAEPMANLTAQLKRVAAVYSNPYRP